MRTVHLVVVGALLAACGGPKGESQGAKTPQELLDEQLRLAEEDEQKRADRGDSIEAGETDLEKKQKFDKVQAKRELTRAARNAAQCGGVVTEEGPGGEADVSLTFAPEGHVKSSTISSEFEGTGVGKCIMRAMNAVIVPAYDGGDVTVDWTIKLESDDEEGEEDE